MKPSTKAEPTARDVARRLASGAPREALAGICDIVRRTPVLTSRSLSEQCGGTILLKAENLQRTGSFKLRGALVKIAAGDAGGGVVAGSAGNHAQSLAYAARARGIACEVFMPDGASVAKVAAVGGFGGTVHLGGDSVDAAVAQARERAKETGATFVHPFDDPDVIVGQGTLGLELLDDVPDLAMVVVPLGGGGLTGGVAGVVKAARPAVRVVGVQATACAPFAGSIAAGRPLEAGGVATIADGIAVKRPGGLTLPLVGEFVDELCTVGEDDIAAAIMLLLERAKLVVEGGGAVGVAALLSGAVRPAASGSTVVVLSGGNIDSGLLAELTRRHETAVGRRLRLFTRVSDRPGGLAALLACIAQTGANLMTIEHMRDALPLAVRQTGVDVLLETRGAEHAEAIIASLRDAGYVVERHEPRLDRP